MIQCPKCQTTDLRLHSGVYRLDTRRRWRLFGPPIVVRTLVGHDCSCLRCLWAFSTVASGTIDSPSQQAHEALKAQRMNSDHNGEDQAKRRAERRLPRMDDDLAEDPRYPAPR